MFREKTDLERNETPKEEAKRLREALFSIWIRAETIEKARGIAKHALRGELTEYEMEEVMDNQAPENFPSPKV